MRRNVGYHIIGKLYGCEEKKLAYVDEVRSIINEVISKTKLTALSHSFHQFEPQGVTYIVLLAESHISIHTWPEFKLAHIDIFTCYVQNTENKEKCRKAFKLLAEMFGAEDVEKMEIER
jgi:S-adenosylmethionine decarboxylase